MTVTLPLKLPGSILQNTCGGERGSRTDVCTPCQGQLPRLRHLPSSLCPRMTWLLGEEEVNLSSHPHGWNNSTHFEFCLKAGFNIQPSAMPSSGRDLNLLITLLNIVWLHWTDGSMLIDERSMLEAVVRQMCPAGRMLTLFMLWVLPQC